MTLTGPWTIALCVLVCLTFPLILVVCWNRGRRRWLAWLFRAVLILTGQLSAVLLAAVLLNDSYNFYGSWQEVAGLQRPHVTSPSVVPGSQDQTLQPRIVRAARTGHGATCGWPFPACSAGPAAIRLRSICHPNMVPLPTGTVRFPWLSCCPAIPVIRGTGSTSSMSPQCLTRPLNPVTLAR